MSAGVVHVVGARPQFVKLAAVLRAQARLGSTASIVHTGQHYDAAMSGVFFEELGLPPPVAHLGVGSGPHGQQTGRMLEALERTFMDLRPAAVVVYGDTNSTLAGALASTKLGVPTVHVEAGLRSFDRRMPEELNRVATDHLCDRLCAPTQVAVDRLRAEGLGDRTTWVGDVMADALLHALARAEASSRIIETLGLPAGGYGVATLHRAASTEPAALPRMLALLDEAARRLGTLVVPLHPRTRQAIAALCPDWPAGAEARGLRLVEPLGPTDMVRLTACATMVLTDSGGLQKEAFLLGVPCVTLRDSTEWTETLDAGANRLATDVRDVRAAIDHHLATGRDRAAMRAAALALYGDGRAGERIAGLLARYEHHNGMEPST